MDDAPETRVQPGQLLARGVARMLAGYGFASIEEFVPHRGLRVDVMAIGPKNEIWIVECKSSRSDFQSDAKWQGYLEWCDRFFWAVDADFPTDLLPEETGLIVGDAYDAEEELPRGIYAALDAFADATPLREVLGTGFCHVYGAVKQAEYDDFLQVISPWEREHLLLNV